MVPATFEGSVAIIKKAQHDFPKMRGGSKAVWNFSKNSSVLVGLSFPKAFNTQDAKNFFEVISQFSEVVCLQQVLRPAQTALSPAGALRSSDSCAPGMRAPVQN